MTSVFEAIAWSLGVAYFGIAIYFWCFAAVHMIGLFTNFKEGKAWGRFIAPVIFMPSFFTDKGNYHREKMLINAGLFILMVGAPMLLVVLIENLAL